MESTSEEGSQWESGLGRREAKQVSNKPGKARVLGRKVRGGFKANQKRGIW